MAAFHLVLIQTTCAFTKPDILGHHASVEPTMKSGVSLSYVSYSNGLRGGESSAKISRQLFELYNGRDIW